MLAVALAIFVISGGAAQSPQGELSTTNFTREEVLSIEPEFRLSWNYNETHIVFRTHVKTEGYIGFGISKDGHMKHSDVVSGWVKNGVGFFNDRYAPEYNVPPVDSQQDWKLIEASESNGYTTLVFIRQLVTCDKDSDLPIKAGPTYVIYSISSHDPAHNDDLVLHDHMGMKQIDLIPTGFNIQNVCK
ncbi:DBH-like monooxygenase protein 2 [Bulinus truncatus]|nr:DBH-like monooxygenase protein 2 [Bulinus truncatus]